MKKHLPYGRTSCLLLDVCVRAFVVSPPFKEARLRDLCNKMHLTCTMCEKLIIIFLKKK